MDKPSRVDFDKEDSFCDFHFASLYINSYLKKWVFSREKKTCHPTPNQCEHYFFLEVTLFKVMSSWSFNLLTLFLGRLSPLSG